jgi:hypothetical protein
MQRHVHVFSSSSIIIIISQTLLAEHTAYHGCCSLCCCRDHLCLLPLRLYVDPVRTRLRYCEPTSTFKLRIPSQSYELRVRLQPEPPPSFNLGRSSGSCSTRENCPTAKVIVKHQAGTCDNAYLSFEFFVLTRLIARGIMCLLVLSA